MGAATSVGPTVQLCHPFTARAIGWEDESTLPKFHSGPHAQALRHLTTAIGAQCSVSYLTDHRLPRWVEVDRLQYRYWPRSIRVGHRHDGFRREWSLSELGHDMVRPSDVTIINSSGHGGQFSQAHARLLRHRRRPYVAMIGGIAATTDGLQRRYLQEASLVVVHNQVLRRRLLAGGLDADRVVLVPLGVDTTKQFVPDGFTTDLGMPTLLYVGRVVRYKCLDALVEAMADVAVIEPNISLRLVGPESDPIYAAELRALAAQLGVAGRISFTGPMPRGDLAEEYRRAALTVLPSEAEGYGMVIAESMGCGTPVLAQVGSGGPEEMITSGIDGMLVGRGDLAPAILALLRAPSELAEMGHSARATAVERLSSDVTDVCFEAIVARSLEGKIG